MSTLYFAIYPSAAAEPTWNGSWSGTPIVSGSEAARETTGVQTWATLATGLDPATDYKIAFVADDGIDTSAVAWSDLWTTLALVTKARPVATISAGAWLPSTGSDLHAMINSETPDDATHIYATTPTVSRFELSATSLPALASRGLNYRTNGTGGGLAVRLYQGASLVAERIHDPVPATITQYTMTLTASELAAVTDETGLFVELEAEDAFVLRTVEAGDLRLTENNNIRILE